jgi:hypothetical protein
MPDTLTRRQFLRSAGGVTFLALVPLGRGLFAATDGSAPDRTLPLFTALPYLQPGDGSVLTEGKESVVVAWQTNVIPATFTVEYGPTRQYGQSAQISRAQTWGGDMEDGEPRTNYRADLSGLSLGHRYEYRVRCNGKTLAEGYFTTRQPRGRKIRFAAFGDNSYGDISDRAIAYQAYLAHPDFVMNTGDNVYDNGLDNEYTRYFFPVYNADVAGPHLGAPLLRSVPFYTVIANHDVHHKDAQKHPVADFDKDPDSLAYFTAMHLPANGPAQTQPPPVFGPDDRLTRFRQCAGPRFPRQANYSYDWGDVHFLCLDSNLYVDPTDAALQAWIEQDLAGTDATWKFVVYHHPAFNVGHEHYQEQHMRVLSPLFEKHGVDICLHGHEHTYQRTQPMKFAPTDTSQAALVGQADRLVPGTFTVDRNFDGKSVTRPDGVLYITTGAGGKHLYDPDMNNDPTKWLHEEDNNVPYLTRFVSDRHSLSLFEIDGGTLTMTQIDEQGQEIDRIRVTKK